MKKNTSQVLQLTDLNFEDEVSNSEMPVLVDFWASWCPPCKAVEPLLYEIASEYDGRIKIGRLNVDQNPRIGNLYNIHGLPTFILFDCGKPMQQKVGAQSKGQLKTIIDQEIDE